MKMRRRQFLSSCTGSVVGTALFPAWLLGKPRSASSIPLQDLNLPLFRELVGTCFEVKTEGGQKVALELVEAQSLCRSPFPDVSNENFSLVFRGPREYLLDQSIYSFEHPQMGHVRIFMVPILSRDTAAYSYQAVFNRTGHQQ